jgi:hypothetical protein
MRNLDVDTLAYLAQTGAHRLAVCFRIVTRDGLVLGYTLHDEPLSVDLGDAYGEVVYQPYHVEQMSDAQLRNGSNSDNMDVTTVLFNDDSIDLQQARAGRFDDADVEVIIVRWDDTTQKVRFLTGYAGEVVADDQTIKITFQQITGKLTINLLRDIRYLCSLDLFVTECGVSRVANEWLASTAYPTRSVRDARGEVASIARPVGDSSPKFWFWATTGGTTGSSEPTWPTTLDATVVDGTVTWKAFYARQRSGVVTEVVNNGSFTASGISTADKYFSNGSLLWTSGNSDGVEIDIFSDDGLGNIELFLPMTKAIQVGDTFTIYAGCDKLIETCSGTFWNTFNHNGFPDVPGLLDALQVGRGG